MSGKSVFAGPISDEAAMNAVETLKSDDFVAGSSGEDVAFFSKSKFMDGAKPKYVPGMTNVVRKRVAHNSKVRNYGLSNCHVKPRSTCCPWDISG